MRKYPARHRALISALKDVRKAAGLSQKALSLKLDQVSTYIHEIENGEHGVRVEEFIAICEACDADPAEVMRIIVRRR